jgi:hypothetical protein
LRYCEPRLIYPICNAFSLATLLMHDRLHGTGFSTDRIDQMGQAFHKHRYLRPDNRFLAARGPLKTFMGPSVGNDGVMSYLRENLVRIEGDDVKIDATGWETLDPGNYSRGTGVNRVSVMAAAKEFGDDELADALEISLDKRYKVVRQNGARAYTGISSWAGRAGGPGGYRRMGAGSAIRQIAMPRRNTGTRRRSQAGEPRRRRPRRRRTRPASAPAPGAVRRARTESVCRLGGRRRRPAASAPRRSGSTGPQCNRSSTLRCNRCDVIMADRPAPEIPIPRSPAGASAW